MNAGNGNSGRDWVAVVASAGTGLGKGVGFTLAFLFVVAANAGLVFAGKIDGGTYAQVVASAVISFFGAGMGKAWADSRNGSKPAPSSQP